MLLVLRDRGGLLFVPSHTDRAHGDRPAAQRTGHRLRITTPLAAAGDALHPPLVVHEVLAVGDTGTPVRGEILGLVGP